MGGRGGGGGGGKHVPECAAEQTGQVAVEHPRGQSASLNSCCQDTAEVLQGPTATPSMTQLNALLHWNILCSLHV